MKREIILTEEKLGSLIKETLLTILKENATTKRKYINRIYKVITPLTSRLYRDEYWLGVNEMVKSIRTVKGIQDVSCHVENGGYREHDGAKWKEYLLDIETELGEIIKGTLNCHAAGTVEDPFSRYDMTLTLY